jgi:hypothetical protein
MENELSKEAEQSVWRLMSQLQNGRHPELIAVSIFNILQVTGYSDEEVKSIADRLKFDATRSVGCFIRHKENWHRV